MRSLLDHLTSDRSCPEWSTHKHIKRIIAVENISYAEVVQIKHSGYTNKAHTFVDISNFNNNSYNSTSV